MANYRRVVTGVTTVRVIVKSLCHLLAVYGTKIRAWIRDNMSEADAATVLAWLDTADAVCAILLDTPDD